MSQVVAVFSFKRARRSIRSVTEYKLKLAKKDYPSKLNGIITLKQNNSNFTAKLFGVQSYINKATPTKFFSTPMVKPLV